MWVSGELEAVTGPAAAVSSGVVSSRYISPVPLFALPVTMTATADAVLAESVLAIPGYLAIPVALFLQHRPVHVIFLLALGFL